MNEALFIEVPVSTRDLIWAPYVMVMVKIGPTVTDHELQEDAPTCVLRSRYIAHNMDTT